MTAISQSIRSATYSIASAAKSLMPTSFKDAAFSLVVAGSAYTAGWGTVGVAGALVASRFTKKPAHQVALLASIAALPLLYRAPRSRVMDVEPSFFDSFRPSNSPHPQTCPFEKRVMSSSLQFTPEQTVVISDRVPLKAITARKQLLDQTIALLKKGGEALCEIFSKQIASQFPKLLMEIPRSFTSYREIRQVFFWGTIVDLLANLQANTAIKDDAKLTIFRNLESLGIIDEFARNQFSLSGRGHGVITRHLLQSSSFSASSLELVFVTALQDGNFGFAEEVLHSNRELSTTFNSPLAVAKELHHCLGRESIDWISRNYSPSQKDWNSILQMVVQFRNSDSAFPSVQLMQFDYKKRTVSLLLDLGADLYHSPETIAFAAKAGLMPVPFDAHWFRQKVPATCRGAVLESYLRYTLQMPFSKDLASEMRKVSPDQKASFCKNIVSNAEMDPAWVAFFTEQFPEFSSQEQLQIMRLSLMTRKEACFKALKAVSKLNPDEQVKLSASEKEFQKSRARLEEALMLTPAVRNEQFWREWEKVAKKKADEYREQIRKALDEPYLTARGLNLENSVFTVPGIEGIIFKTSDGKSKVEDRYNRSKQYYDLASSYNRIIVPRSYLVSIETRTGPRVVMIEEKLSVLDYRYDDNSIGEVGRLMSIDPRTKAQFEEIIRQAVTLSHKGNLNDLAARNVPILSDLSGIAFLDTDQSSNDFHTRLYKKLGTTTFDSFAARCGLECLETMRNTLKSIDPAQFTEVNFEEVERESRSEIQRAAFERKASLLEKAQS
jgi:hypothetical protein